MVEDRRRREEVAFLGFEPESIYIAFRLIKRNPATNVYAVWNEDHAIVVGRVKWHGAFRKYAFFPVKNDEMAIDSGCLKDIARFMDTLMEARKK